jgi:membrane protein DedA with SNARE-associated domain
MSESTSRFISKKRVVIAVCYFVLLAASFGYQKLFKGENEKNKVPNSDSITTIYIADPVYSNLEQFESFDDKFLVIELERESVKDQAANVVQLTDSLKIVRYHLIGEGIGGSVAMHIAAQASLNDSIESLTLINSHGIVELEVLGGAFLNQAIYQGKKIGFQLLKALVPHFGSLDFLNNHITRAEIQVKSDHQEIREILKTIQLPVSVIHTADAEVRKEVVTELHRLLPQSELQVLSRDEIDSTIAAFHQRVDTQDVKVRSEVSMAADILSKQPFDASNSIKAEGKALIILMLVIIFSTFITEDLTCIGTGLLIARGMIGFFPGVLACLIGIFVGDILVYLMGRWVAKGTLNKAPLKWFISEKDLELSYYWFEAKGPAIIIASRFIPGSRFPTYVSAGAIGANFFTFIFYFGIASLMWTPILVGLAVVLGNEMIEYFTVYQEYAIWALVGLFSIFYILIKIIIPSFTYKGRRLLVGRFRRKAHWEFWPPVVLYLPVVIYIIGLWIKHKSIALVTLANPGIEYGGLVKESKSKILRAIQKQDAVANFRVINADERAFSDCLTFISDNKLTFPVVLKPDIGERGKQVVIPKNEMELKRMIAQFSSSFIIQEYINGKEFGVFYARYPNQDSGDIISITQKEYLWITGDGKHTLEELILKDERAVCMANTHFEQHADHLFNIIPKGKSIKLVEVGTHSRGAIFKDGIHLKTEALVKRIDEISNSIDGFYCGRFDIKVPDETHFKEGNNLKVLELNGITSEATHIYDPRYPYWYAVKTLCTQWKMAYEIANQVNIQQPDEKIPSLRALIKLFG